MFPSGRWRGFWEAAGWGRRAMDPLFLRFNDGQIDGEGDDCIGPFTFSGSYGDGEVRMVKQYIGRHSVLYEGRVDGEGAVIGRWFIEPFWSGPFVLAPIVEGVSALPIHAITAAKPPVTVS
jgi:hypothetical protein